MLFDIVRLGSATLWFTDVLLIIVFLLLLAPIRIDLDLGPGVARCHFTRRDPEALTPHGGKASRACLVT